MERCMIIAAGMGTRLSGVGDSKPMVPLLGIPLIIRVIDIARGAGVTDFYVVTGYNAGKIKETLTRFSKEHDVSIQFIDNDEWEKPNGISVLKGRGHINGPFFLLMSDHMFDAAILRNLSASPLGGGEVTLAVDTRLQDNPLPRDTTLNVNVPDVPYEELRGFQATRLGYRHRAEPVIE
ncbi:MAG: NTP transferase domain-containing protein, partial [bacterium]|nr:NTP transferase domain-containing protein [bacterium]